MSFTEDRMDIITMYKPGIFRREAVFFVNTDGTYRQEHKPGVLSELANDFADIFLTLSAKGWRVKCNR